MNFITCSWFLGRYQLILFGFSASTLLDTTHFNVRCSLNKKFQI